MSIEQLINRPCKIIQRSPGEEKDEYGNPILVETVTETDCELQQAQGFRTESGDQVSDTRWVLYLRQGEQIGADASVFVEREAVDSFDLAGWFEVHGEPWPARNPRTRVVSHIEVSLRRTAAPGDDS